MDELRQKLIETTLAWEKAFCNAPSIVSALSEFDAAMLIGCSIEEYAASMQGATVVRKGYDFKYKSNRYQVKGRRASGKPGSAVWRVPKPKNYEWDYLIFVHYTPEFEIQEAYLWDVETYKAEFDSVSLVTPKLLRAGQRLV